MIFVYKSVKYKIQCLDELLKIIRNIGYRIRWTGNHAPSPAINKLTGEITATACTVCSLALLFAASSVSLWRVCLLFVALEFVTSVYIHVDYHRNFGFSKNRLENRKLKPSNTEKLRNWYHWLPFLTARAITVFLASSLKDQFSVYPPRLRWR